MVPTSSGKPICTHLISQKLPQCCFWNIINGGLMMITTMTNVWLWLMFDPMIGFSSSSCVAAPPKLDPLYSTNSCKCHNYLLSRKNCIMEKCMSHKSASQTVAIYHIVWQHMKFLVWQHTKILHNEKKKVNISCINKLFQTVSLIFVADSFRLNLGQQFCRQLLILSFTKQKKMLTLGSQHMPQSARNRTHFSVGSPLDWVFFYPASTAERHQLRC